MNVTDGLHKGKAGEIVYRGRWKKDTDYDEVRIKYGLGRFEEVVVIELDISLLIPVSPLKKQLADVGVTLG